VKEEKVNSLVLLCEIIVELENRFQAARTVLAYHISAAMNDSSVHGLSEEESYKLADNAIAAMLKSKVGPENPQSPQQSD